MPLMPLSGVRISWLIWLMKSVRSWAFFMARDSCLRAVSMVSCSSVTSVAVTRVYSPPSTEVNVARMCLVAAASFGMR